MHDSSRMLHRMRRGFPGGRVRIPRKGRIRGVLVVGALLLGVWFFVRHPSHHDAARKPTPRPRAVTSAPAPKPAPPTPPKPPRRVHTPFSFFHAAPIALPDAAIGSLLTTCASTVSKPVETLHDNGRDLVVYSSVDTALQGYARRLMERYGPRYGAAVVLDPSSGRIFALVSFTNDSVPPIDARLYCRSVFPAASVFKTITAAAAIEKKGLNPESPLRHAGRNHTLYKFQLEEDLKVSRDIPLGEAFAYSINPVFARIGLYLVGCNGLREYAQRFGFLSQVPFVFPVDTSRLAPCDSAFELAELASGFNQQTTLSPMLGALIAGAIADDGRMMRPTLIDSVVDAASLRVLHRAEPQSWLTPITPQTAAELRTIMSKVTHMGTARESFRYVRASFGFRDLLYGGKTGSVDKEGLGKIDWFIGFLRHPTDPHTRLAVSVVTTHGDYWTVHSGFVAAELMRLYIRNAEREHQDMPHVNQPDRGFQ